MAEPDAIRIEQLELTACIGVPDEERATPQRLTVTLTLFPKTGFHDLGDDITRTVDYFAVCQRVKAETAARPRRLVETLADELAGSILHHFPIAAIEVEVRKYILSDTVFVAAQIRRENPHAALPWFG